MAKKLVVFLFLLSPLFHSCQQPKSSYELVLPSPEAQIHVYFNLNEGEPYYLVYYKNEIIINWSLLGFTLQNQVNLTSELFFVKVESGSNSFSEELSFENGISLSGKYNEITIYLEKSNPVNMQFAVIFRAYDNGVAFCYLFPENENADRIFLVSEETRFDLYGPESNWQTPSSKIHEGGNDIIIPEQVATKMYDLPVSFISIRGFTVTLSESKESNYPQMKLGKRTSGKLQYNLQPIESKPSESIIINRGIKTPWRTIIISETINTLSYLDI